MSAPQAETANRICIVDDDIEFGRFAQQFFTSPSCEVDLYPDSESFLRSANIPSYDFFLVDLTLPGTDGVELIHMIRRQSEAGIIIISGRMGPDAFNAGLTAGADMFLNKPVRFDQIALAMATVRRRLKASGPSIVNWTLASADGVLRCSNGKSVTLSPQEGQILIALSEAGSEGLDRAGLAQAAGAQETESGRNLDAAMFRLRKKIERACGQPAPLKTVRGVGYASNAAIEVK